MTITSISGKYGDMTRPIVVQVDYGIDHTIIHELRYNPLITLEYDEAIALRDALNLIYPPRSLSNCDLHITPHVL